MNKSDSEKIKLVNARLAFSSVFEKSEYNGKEQYRAVFLIPKSDKKQKDLIESNIKRFLKENNLKVDSGKTCFGDGDEKDYDGFKDHWYFKTASNYRPVVVDRNRNALAKEDEVVYDGCYVNTHVQLWHYNNTNGKGLSANFLSIQFVKDGEPFVGTKIDVPTDFDDLDDNDEDPFSGEPEKSMEDLKKELKIEAAQAIKKKLTTQEELTKMALHNFNAKKITDLDEEGLQFMIDHIKSLSDGADAFSGEELPFGE